MEVIVKLNEKGEVSEWASVGNIVGGKTYVVDENLWRDNWYGFRLNDDQLIYDESLKNKVNEKNNAVQLIIDYKKFLRESDYQAIKYAEGLISDEDYLNIKQQRMNARSEINRLEELIKDN